MKKNRIFLLLCCALLPALLRAQAPQERESILIISSYNPDTRRMSGFIAEFERNIMASGIPCDIYVETLECKSINDAPIWMSQTENMISRYENKGLRAIVLLGQEAWASFVSLGHIPKDVMCFCCYVSSNGIVLPPPEDSLGMWLPPSINYMNMTDSREGDDAMHETYASLSHRSAAILGTWRVGRDGEYLMQRSLNDLVQFNPRIPVFSISQIGIGDVAVGGYVPKYENAASVIASQIKEYYASGKIDGTHFRLTDGQYLFDSRKLKELKIAEYALPKGSVVEDTVAAKLSKYSHYIELLVAGIVLLVLLLVFVAALFLRTRRLKRTLEEREGQLVVAREKAEESDMLKSAFLANMSHEIRTPLNAIVGFSSLMQGEELSQEERAEYCAIVVNNSEMLLTLLNDILDISSLECGKIKFNCSSEEIVQVCQHVLMTTAHTRQEGVEGRLECAVGSYMLVTDVHRLSQILINLLTNAGKFTSQGSITLGVEIDEAHREVLFSVADTGPGIPLDKQEMVFNRFEKLDGNKKKGTGLGLAICRQIAMIFGGRIWVDPTYTAGARFVFAHPIDIRFPEDGENRGGVSPLEAPGSSR